MLRKAGQKQKIAGALWKILPTFGLIVTAAHAATPPSGGPHTDPAKILHAKSAGGEITPLKANASSSANLLKTPAPGAFGFTQRGALATRSGPATSIHASTPVAGQAKAADHPIAAASMPDVVVDNTLGAVAPITLIGGSYAITQGSGKQVGGNLFFSFSAFNLARGETASFQGPASVQTVLARVTGTGASNIDGVLQCTIPNADLYLINPNGINFGPDSKLNVQGSFATGAADYLRLTDGMKFTSAPSPGDATLTAAAPAAFGFLAREAGAVTVMDSVLQLAPGKVLTIIGGNADIDGATIDAQSGRINVLATASAAELVFNPVDPTSSVQTSSFAQLGSIEMRNAPTLLVSGIPGSSSFAAGGSIQMRGGNIQLGNAKIAAVTFGPTSGGPIDIQANGSLTLQGGIVSTSIGANAGNQATAGQINVSAASIEISQGGQIIANTFGPDTGGAIVLKGESITIDGVGSMISAANAGQGVGGQIDINATSLKITNGAQISAQTLGPAPGGAVIVNSAAINIVGTGNSTIATGILADTYYGSSGNGGTVQIFATTLAVSNAGAVSTTTNGSGRGGNITIDANLVTLHSGENLVPFTGLGSNTQLPPANYTGPLPTVFGSGGDVTVNAKQLKIYPGAGIAAISRTTGNGGKIDVDVRLLLIRGAGVASDTGLSATTTFAGPGGGMGGDIQVMAGRVRLLDGGLINAGTIGSGNAGSIMVDATDAINLGRQGAISTSAVSSGGGQIMLDAGEILRLSDATVTAQAGANGGGIIMQAGLAVELFNSKVVTMAGKNGGNISINPEIVVLQNTMVSANGGINGGNMTVKPATLLETDSRITETGARGVSGQLLLTPPDLQLAGSLVAPPASLQPPGAGLAPSCALRLGADFSSFVVTGQAGRPPEPSGWMPDLPLLDDSFRN